MSMRTALLTVGFATVACGAPPAAIAPSPVEISTPKAPPDAIAPAPTLTGDPVVPLTAWWSPSCRQLALHLGADLEESDAVHHIALWNLKTAAFVGVVSMRSGWGSERFDGIEWSEDESVIGASAYNALRLWRTADLEEVASLESFTVYGMFELATDASHVVYANSYGPVRWITLPDQKVIAEREAFPPGPSGIGIGLNWAAGGELLLMHAGEGAPELWRKSDGKTATTLTLPDERAPVFSDVLPAGDRVVVAGADGGVGVFDARTGKLDKTLRKPVHTREVDNVLPGARLSRDGRHLATLEANGRLTVFDLETAGSVELRAGDPDGFSWYEPLAFSPSGRFIEYGWASQLHVASVAPPHTSRILDAPFVDFGAGDEVYTWTKDGLVGATATGKVLRSHPPPPGVTNPLPVSMCGGRLAAILGRDIDVVRLADGKAVRLAMRRTTEAVRGAPLPPATPADVTALLD